MRWLGTNEAAEYCGVHRNTLLKAAYEKRLRGCQRVSPKGQWKFRLVDLDRWMES